MKFRFNPRHFWALGMASIRMYFRNATAVFFTLLFPIMLVLIFGMVDFDRLGSTFEVGLVNASDSELSRELISGLRRVEALRISELSEAEAHQKLSKGKTDLIVFIPPSFGKKDASGKWSTEKMSAFYSEANPQKGRPAGMILSQVASEMNRKVLGAPEVIGLKIAGIKTSSGGFFSFLFPGIVAMSIMQLGIFSVAFAFVAYKNNGVLRRLQATPAHPVHFILGQAVARLLIGELQVVVLIALAVLVFHLHVAGNLAGFFALATLGVLVFLSFGFAVAGWARDEKQAAPLANLISFPMMFLSGLFFPRENFPAWLHGVTSVLPLTYLADGLRRIAGEGASLWAVRGDLLGLGLWGIFGFVVAVWLFRWE